MVCNVFIIQAQTIGEAKLWFKNGEFKKALPVFQREIKSKPKDASLNFWLGVCLFETGQAKKSFNHLLFAKNRRIQNADLYLASYFFATGSPDSSVVYIDNFLAFKDLSDETRSKAENLRQSAINQIELMQRVEDVCFIDSVVVSKKDLYKTLSISKETGSLLQKKSGFAFTPERYDREIYADSISNRKLELFVKHRILDSWDKPEKLPEPVSSAWNEMNPFFMQDGMTLYFASDRPDGLGKYDLYVTRLNPTTNSYLLPERLNMPFNSPFNDFFLVIDETENRGYLATDRNSAKDKVTIYTFIPTTTKTFIKNLSNEELINFSKITSIRSTWKGKNVDSLKLNRNQIIQVSNEINSETGLAFRINDKITYSKVSEFKSEEARKTFSEYKSLFNKIKETFFLLEEKRTQFSNLEENQRNIIEKEILNLEKDLLNMQKTLPLLEIKVRNLELQAISK